MQKKLTKSTDKRICGVCAGIAEFMDIDPTIVRAAYAVLSFACSCFPGVLLYIALAIAMPAAGTYKAVETGHADKDHGVIKA